MKTEAERKAALKLLAQLQEHEPIDPSRPIPPEIEKALRVLEFLYPFSLFQGKLILFGIDGAASTYIGPRHVLIALKAGRTPEEIVANAEKIAEANAADFHTVFLFRGLKAESKIDIQDGVVLVPPEDAPPSVFADQVFGGTTRRARITISEGFPLTNYVPGGGMVQREAVAAAALVVTQKLTPVATSEMDWKVFGALRETRDEIVANLRRAALLASEHAIVVPVSYSVSAELDYPGIMHMMHNLGPDGFVPPDSSVDIKAMLSEYRALTAVEKGTKEALGIAIDRIGSSRLDRNEVDSAIDLGIAMEVLLMHGEGEDNKEISHKIGLRAGWLLGTTVTERRAAKKQAGLLYLARSKAAHTGKRLPEFDKQVCDRFVTALAREVSRRGKFPDWTELTFGG